MTVGFGTSVIFPPSTRKSKVTASPVGKGGRRGSVDARVLYLFFLNQLDEAHTWGVESSASGVSEDLELSLWAWFRCCWCTCV